jgi:hypothetical protein
MNIVTTIIKFIVGSWAVEVPMFIFNVITNAIFIIVVGLLIPMNLDIIKLSPIDVLYAGLPIIALYIPYMLIMSLCKGIYVKYIIPYIARWIG